MCTCSLWALTREKSGLSQSAVITCICTDLYGYSHKPELCTIYNHGSIFEVLANHYPPLSCLCHNCKIAILKTSFPTFTEMIVWSVILIMSNRWYWSFRKVILIILNTLNLEINRKTISYTQPEIGSTAKDNWRRNDYERILKMKVNNRSMFFLHLDCRFFIWTLPKLTIYIKKENRAYTLYFNDLRLWCFAANVLLHEN